MVGTCKYCGEQEELCKAHIIPRCFYDRSIKYASIFTDGGKPDLIRSQDGPKDTSILCKKCDPQFGPYDDYGKTLLLDIVPKHRKGTTQAFIVEPPEFCYSKWRKFIISLVWRASISKITKEVFLGEKYEQIALEILKGERPDEAGLFIPVIFKKTTDNAFINYSGITQKKILGQKGILLDMNAYQIYVITNARPIQDSSLKILIENEGLSLFVMEHSPDDKIQDMLIKALIAQGVLKVVKKQSQKT